MTPNELKELKAQLEELVEKGFYLTQFIPVGRTSIIREKERWIFEVVDYRQLNQMIVKNKYPLPRVVDLLDQL